MRVVVRKIYRGPNIYTSLPVIRWRLDLGVLKDWPTGRIGHVFVDALLEHLSGLRHHPGPGDKARDFATSMIRGEGIPLACVLERVAVELQKLAGTDAVFSDTRRVDDGVFDILVGYQDPRICSEALILGTALVVHLLPPKFRPKDWLRPGFDFFHERDQFLRFVRQLGLDQTGQALVTAAEKRDIPWFRIESGQLYVQLGQCRNLKRIYRSFTSETSHIAFRLSNDKRLAASVMRSAGLPVPPHGLVRDADAAVQLAARLGYPVVVKPLMSDVSTYGIY